MSPPSLRTCCRYTRGWRNSGWIAPEGVVHPGAAQTLPRASRQRLSPSRSPTPTRLPDLILGFPAPLRLSPPRERFNSAAQAREHVLRLASSAGRIVNMPPQITHSLTLPARPFLPYVGRLESTRRFGRGRLAAHDIEQNRCVVRQGKNSPPQYAHGLGTSRRRATLMSAPGF